MSHRWPAGCASACQQSARTGCRSQSGPRPFSPGGKKKREGENGLCGAPRCPQPSSAEKNMEQSTYGEFKVVQFLAGAVDAIEKVGVGVLLENGLSGRDGKRCLVRRPLHGSHFEALNGVLQPAGGRGQVVLAASGTAAVMPSPRAFSAPKQLHETTKPPSLPLSFSLPLPPPCPLPPTPTYRLASVACALSSLRVAVSSAFWRAILSSS